MYKRKATEERRKAKALMLLMCGCRNNEDAELLTYRSPMKDSRVGCLCR